VKIAESVAVSMEQSALNSRPAIFTRSDEGHFEGENENLTQGVKERERNNFPK